MGRNVQLTGSRRVLTVVASLGALVVYLSMPSLRAAPAQSQGSPTQDQAAKPAQMQDTGSEITTSDNQSIIKVRVPVVVVRVVVKDAAGNIVENLKKEDFQVRDNDKPQEITTFTVEHPGSRTVRNLEEDAPSAKEEPSDAKAPGISVPGRFVVLLLDDIHIRTEAALAVRVHTMNVIQSLSSRDLVAVYSTSGRIQQDFTTDRDALSQTVSRLMPSPITSGSGSACAQISYFQAQLMVAFRDQDATTAAIDNIWSCKYGKIDSAYATAVMDANQTALGMYGMGDVELEQAMRRIGEIVGRLSEMPGDRAIVFVSPGFASMDIVGKLSPILDRAIKANVVVNTVDARGLYVPDTGLDASSRGPCMAGGMNPNPDNAPTCTPEATSRFQVVQQSAMNEVLSGLALGTGGTWFHNRNDLDKGIQDALSSPSTSYVLSFSPASRTLNGKFHKLKVTVQGSKALTVQARTGYFASKPESDPEKLAESDFHGALFAQDEMNEIPIDVHTKFFLKQADEASLSVLAHIDVKGVHFRKVSGRNYDQLTVGITIFDDHGNFVTGNKRTLTLKLLDATLEHLHNTGLTVKMDFDLKPGTYIVRVVSRDAVGATMSAHNGGVVIPN